MGNLVSHDVEGAYKKVCQDLLDNDPETNTDGCLHWASPPLQKEQLEHFMECLGKNTSLKRLVLRDLEAIALTESPSLVKAILGHSSLECLGFSGRMPKENFQVFVDAFLQSRSLHELEIENSIIPADTIDGVISILQQQEKPTNKISSLKLQGCQVEASELARLTKALDETASSVATTLKVLEITLKPPIVAEEAAQHLAQFVKAKDSVLLDINFDGFLAQSMPVLAEGMQGHASLQRLQFKGRGVNENDSIVAIGKLLCETPPPKLRVLDLSECQLTAASVSQLAKSFLDGKEKCAKLEELHLANNWISDDGTVALCKILENPDSTLSKHLKVLDLRNNRIGTAGIMALAKSFAHNDINKSILECLYLGEQSVRPSRRFEDEEAQALAGMIQSNTILKEISLEDGSFLDDEGIEGVMNAVTQNATLKTFKVPCFSTARLRMMIAKLPKLTLEKMHIYVSDCELDEEISKALLESLEQSKSLLEFSIDGFTQRSELAWKALRPKIDELLAARNNETDAPAKRPIEKEENGGEGEDESAKRAKTD